MTRTVKADTRGSLSRTQVEALDCWIHGVAHLCAEFDQQRALRIMATVIVELADKRATTAGNGRTPGPSVGRSG